MIIIKLIAGRSSAGEKVSSFSIIWLSNYAELSLVYTGELD